MKIAEGLEMLELTVDAGGRSMLIHPVIAYGADGYALIDTGMPGSDAGIMRLAREAGIGPGEPEAVILTHQDIDHIGGLAELMHRIGRLDVYAHADDKPYIDGELPMIKMNAERKAALLGALPEGPRERLAAFFSAESGPNVTRTMADGDTLPFAGGLTVVATPGHTPGHISLYHKPSGTLIAGDAMVVADGVLQGPNPSVTPDMDTALDSLRKLADFEINAVVCYHGGLYGNEPNKRIAEIAARQ